MVSRFFLQTTVPTVLISTLLLASGVVAAWYVQRLQAGNSELVAREVYSVLAAEDFKVTMRDIRFELLMFMRSGDTEHFAAITKLHEAADGFLSEAKVLARTSRERELIDAVQPGYERFFREYARIASSVVGESQRIEFERLLNETLEKEVLKPARDYVRFNREVIRGTTAESRVLANRIRAGLLLLGACGALGGLVAGFGIARGIKRSIVELQVPIQGAAGKLNEVIAPFAVSVSGGFDDLTRVLQEIDKHIGLIVERLHEREREVLRSEQLAALGRLAAGIAHELRNPLMPVKFLVQAATETGNGLHGRDLIVIDQELTRMDESIQAFLDFARPPQLEKSRVDIRVVLEQTIDLVTRRAEKQEVVIRRRLPQSPTIVEADQGQLFQLFLNLLLNGLDALPNGGVIEASIIVDSSTEREGGSPSVTMIQNHRSRWVLLRIVDSGFGFPKELYDRIFEPFVSAKETGTGLGLSICQRIAEAHGGDITAANRTEGGAEITLRLPAVDSETTTLELSDTSNVAFSKRRKD